MSAYFLWLNENRADITKKNPDLSMAQIGKKAGELWRDLDADEKKVSNNLR